MKRTVLALTLVATVAGVASAHRLLPTSELVPTPEPAVATSSISPKPPSEATPGKAVITPPRSATRGLETNRKPVPLLVSQKSTFTPTETATLDAPAQEKNAAPSETTSTTTEQSAKAAIERDGYKGVRGLNRVGEDRWTALALRGTTEVSVTVDATGNVSAH
jgi:hypothetical protein